MLKEHTLLRMKQIPTIPNKIYKGKRKHCRLCGDKINDTECIEVWSHTNTFVGHFHAACIKNAYNIMLLNKI